MPLRRTGTGGKFKNFERKYAGGAAFRRNYVHLPSAGRALHPVRKVEFLKNMNEELNLVADLAVILVAAGVFTVISKALKQPLILGYIIAGFIVGPHLGLFPKLTSAESVEQWSEIGIIFLLFALGLEFSFKKLLKVGSSALIMAGSKFIGMFVVGLIAAYAMGWSTMESIFLGGLLSMSSTTIIIKAYEEMGLKKRPYASLVFGTLVVEDLIAILLLVLLSTLAVSKRFAGGEMLWGICKLVFFLVLWFLVGIYVIPTLLKKAHKYLNDEILLITSIGLCFAMVAIASLAGFSSALGAFVMGSILAETIEGERIEHLVKSLKDLFGAVFFVSVGMMMDPAVIAEHWATVLIITVITMTGIVIFSSGGVLLAGQGLRNAVHSGFSLAQLGEFAFIIAGLGCSLGVMRDFIYPVIIAVSVITTFTTPYMIKAADPVCDYLERKLPKRILDRINPSPEQDDRPSAAEQSEWRRLLKSYFLRILLYGILLTAILIGSKIYLEPAVSKLLPHIGEGLRNVISVGITCVVMAPFLYGLGVSGGDINSSAAKLLKEKPSNRWPVLSLSLIRSFIAIAFVLELFMAHFRLSWWLALLISVAGVAFFLTARRSARKYSPLELKFMSNLNQKEDFEKLRAPVTASVKDKLSGYDVHIGPFVVSADSQMVGKELRSIPELKDSGVNIVKIQRGSHSILIPRGTERIYPCDRLLAVGTDEQTAAFGEAMKAAVRQPDGSADEEFTVEKVTLDSVSYLTGKTLRDTDMRSAGCMVISVLGADGKFRTNPKPDYRFRDGDTVWLAGTVDGCSWYGK